MSKSKSSTNPKTHKKVEEKLQAEDQRFRALAEQSSDIILLVNREEVVIYENNAVERILGFKAEERIGSKVFDNIHPDELNFITDTFNALFADENAPTQKDEVRIRDINGNWRIFEIVASNLTQNNVVDAIVVNLRDITERKKAEKLLRESEEQYRLLADHMKDQVWLMDLNLNMAYISPSVEKLMGYTIDELQEHPLDKLLTETSLKKAMEFFSVEMPSALDAPSDYVLNRSLELEFRCKDGHTLWGENTFSFIRDENGKPVSLLSEGREITERKRAEEALRESETRHRQNEERYRNILDHMEEAYYEVDLKGHLTFFNTTAVTNLAYTDDEMLGMSFHQYVDKNSESKVFEAFHRVFLTGESIKGVDWELISKAGEKKPVESSISLMRDIQGNPVGFRGIIRDITERKRAEEALRQSEERYRNILDNMEEAYYEVDLKGNLTFFNTAAVKNLGYTDNVMMGMNFRQYVDDENAGKVFEAYRKVFLTGESIKGVDWELISKESGKIPVESSISLMRDTQGNPIGFRGIIRDITERKQAEEALHESEAKFRNFTETAQDAIVTINMNGIITYANPAAKALAQDMAVVGMALKDFLPPDSVEHHVDMIELLSSGFSETLSYESRIMRPQDNYPLYFDVKSTTLFNRGEPSGVLFIARDATERKRTEEEIRMMAIVDTLTGLYNRRGFIALAEQQMKTAVRNNKKLLLFFIDLDGLKFINDTWGHEEGDHALKRTSLILKQTFRESDIISRLGGDEFAALVADSPELPEVILKRLLSRTDDENAASDLPYQISMSIGVADYDPSVPCSIHALMSRADQLMYHQKKEKKQTGKYPV